MYGLNNGRGVIRNRELAQQIKDFSKMRYGNITPTDIDFFIDYKNRCFVFAELKREGTELRLGQHLALERLCDACAAAGIDTILFIAEHNVPAEDDIDVSETMVVKYRHNQKWHTRAFPKTLKEETDIFILRHEV